MDRDEKLGPGELAVFFVLFVLPFLIAGAVTLYWYHSKVQCDRAGGVLVMQDGARCFRKDIFIDPESSDH